MRRGRGLTLMAVISLLIGLIAAPAFADGTVNWDGNGVENGELGTVDCESSNGDPYLFWVFTPGGSHSVTEATLTVNGDDYPMTQQGGGAYQATTSWYDLGGITASVAYVGDLGSGVANLVISHGCPPQVSEWCSPGFWRANYNNWGASEWPVDPDTKYNDVISSPTATGDPSLIEVLQDPGAYFAPKDRGAAFNAVGDYLSGLHPEVGFTGERTEDSCPLDQN